MTICYEKAKEYLQNLGYSIHWHAGDFSQVGFSKIVQDRALHITIEVDEHNKVQSMQLNATAGLFTISSGDISIPHNNFVDWFEEPLIGMLNKIER